MVVCSVLTVGLAAYQNDWDDSLYVMCNTRQGEALYRVQSVHSNITVRETVAGCGSVNGLFQEQCSSAAGVPGVNMVNKLTLTPSAKTQE